MESSKVMGLLCRSLREMQETRGVTPQRVFKFVESRYGVNLPRVNRARLLAAMQRGVQEGFLVNQGNKFDLNMTTARRSCLCRRSRSKRRSKGKKCKRKVKIGKDDLQEEEVSKQEKKESSKKALLRQKNV